jgi:outer membrane protein OmpA-like peptidoglycan-associated protein
MKRSSLLTMILMISIQFAMAQQGENLVQNGTFEQGDVGFKSDFQLDTTFGNVESRIRYRITNRFPFWVMDSLGINAILPLIEDEIVLPVVQSTENFLVVDVNASGKQRLWYDSITIKPNTIYSFSCTASHIDYTPPFRSDIVAKSQNFGVIKLCVNGKKVSKELNLKNSNEWRTLSGKFTSGPDQTKIEISIEDWRWPNHVALDNIFFKEIQPAEFVKKEEPVVVISPPVKKEEPVAVITPPVKKEAAEIEIPPVKEEEPVVEIPTKTEPPVVVPPKEKTPIIVPPKQIHPVEVPSKPKLTEVVPPKPKPPVVIQPKKKPSVVVLTKPVKKDTASEIVAASADFKKDISIDDIKVDQKLQLSHIYFERAKFNLLPASLPELNDLADFMKRYPTVRIRLEGHTDNQGNPERNVELSENRAKEVKKYLFDQSIDENRIEWIGYGGQRPIHNNADADEYLRQKNRRVEIVILSK